VEVRLVTTVAYSSDGRLRIDSAAVIAKVEVDLVAHAARKIHTNMYMMNFISGFRRYVVEHQDRQDRQNNYNKLKPNSNYC